MRLEYLINNDKKKTITIVIIILLVFIYLFSSMDFFKTNNLSKNFTKSIVKIVDKPADEKKLNELVNNINSIVQKLAHIFLFFVLAVFILIFDKLKYKVLRPKYNVIAILICFIYGSLDEIHQLFVFCRSSKFSDVLIDTSENLLGCNSSSKYYI